MKPVADWLRIPVTQVADTPLWWIDKAVIALEAEREAARRQQQNTQTQDTIARMHGGG